MQNEKRTRMGFTKATISFPRELAEHSKRRKEEAQHAGSFSSYVRSLIIADRDGAAGRTKRGV